MSLPIITIIGGGFGGVYSAKQLLKKGFKVRLISQDEFFTFTPLLHEVATGTLHKNDVCFPIKSFLNNSNLEIICGSVRELDLATSSMVLQNDSKLNYEYLIIATGARSQLNNFPTTANVLYLKNIFDAVAIKKRIREIISKQNKININIIGAGLTGVELAFELSHLLTKTIKRVSRINLFSRGELPLKKNDPKLANYIEQLAKKVGITFYENIEISSVTASTVFSPKRSFDSDLTIFTNGIIPNTELLPKNYKDNKGNLLVTSQLNLPNYPKVFALGDIINIIGQAKPAMLAQLAVQEALVVAHNIERQVKNKTLVVYKSSLKGILFSLGSFRAAGRIFGLPISGLVAWYLWRTVYLFKTPGWHNRFRVMYRWTFYLFKKRYHLHRAD